MKIVLVENLLSGSLQSFFEVEWAIGWLGAWSYIRLFSFFIPLDEDRNGVHDDKSVDRTAYIDTIEADKVNYDDPCSPRTGDLVPGPDIYALTVEYVEFNLGVGEEEPLSKAEACAYHLYHNSRLVR